MKNLLAGLLVAAVLIPAAEVTQQENARGREELVTMAQTAIKQASDKNKGHAWMKLHGYNFTQQYALQTELRTKGYDYDIPMFGSAYVGW